METVINLHQDFHPETARLIVAGILFIPFAYLLTYKPAKKSTSRKRHSRRSNSYQKLYQQVSDEQDRDHIDLAV
jgi:hypothetical protein